MHGAEITSKEVSGIVGSLVLKVEEGAPWGTESCKWLSFSYPVDHTYVLSPIFYIYIKQLDYKLEISI